MIDELGKDVFSAQQAEIRRLQTAIERIYDLTLEPIGPRTAYKALSEIRLIVRNNRSPQVINVRSEEGK